MIRIRYRGPNELSPGLHVTAERHGRTTTVYLLSGMTAAQRRSALRRLRLTARMGHCPRLPAGQLGFALFTDRIRTGFGRTGAVLRLHPAGSTVPIMVLSGGAIAFLLFSTVSIHVLHPRTANQPGPATPAASAGPIAIGGGSRSQATGPGGPGNQPNPGVPGGSRHPSGPSGLSRGSQPGQPTQPGRGSGTASPVLAAGGEGTGASTGSGSGGSGSGGSGSDVKNSSGKSRGSGVVGGTTLSGGSNPTQATTPPQTTPATSPPAPPPTTTAATPPSSSGGVCVNVGPLGVCLNV